MTPVKIRIGVETDLPQVLALIQELAVYEKAGDQVEVTADEMRGWGFGPDRVFEFFVAEKADAIVGTAIYYYKYSTWKGKCLFLEDLIVNEPERCQGIGSQLMQAVIEKAKNQRLRRIEWQVLNWNEPAMAFYRKFKASFDDEWINCRIIPQPLEN